MFLEFLGASVPARHSTSHAHTCALWTHLADPPPLLDAMRAGISAVNEAMLAEAVVDPSEHVKKALSPGIWGSTPTQPAEASVFTASAGAGAATSTSEGGARLASRALDECLALWACLPGPSSGWVPSRCPDSRRDFVRLVTSYQSVSF